MKGVRLHACMGLLLEGVDLRQLLASNEKAALPPLLAEHKLLLFRGQELDPSDLARLAACFGGVPDLPATPTPAPTHAECRQVQLVHNDADRKATTNIWHADSTWRTVPPAGAVLQCIRPPVLGGDTLWASMGAVFEGLSAALREVFLAQQGLHTLAASAGAQEHFLTPEGGRDYARLMERFPPVVHPAVIRHPWSGRSVLFVNRAYTQRIVGLQREESDALLRMASELVARPEFQLRIQWGPGTIAVWDNCATQHYAVNDYYPDSRAMRRVAFDFPADVKRLCAARQVRSGVEA